MKFKVGQTLWLVPPRHFLNASSPEERGFEVVVAKVGTKYLTVTDDQHKRAYEISKDNLCETVRHDAARAYLTHEAFIEHRASRAAWLKLRARVSGTYNKPAYLTADAINAILDMLKDPTG